MIAMWMMQSATHEVIDVVSMGHGCVAAGWAMLVRAVRLRRTLHGIGGGDRDDMLINMILVHVVEVTVMQIIDVAFVANGRMATVGAMLVGMVRMMLLGTGSHAFPFLAYLPFNRDRRSSPFGSVRHRVLHQPQNMGIGKRIKDVFCLSPPFN